MDRTAFLTGAAAFAATGRAPDAPLAELEARYGGRLGVAAVESSSGLRVARRDDQRFPMCSTFKLLLVAAVLTRVDAGQEQFTRVRPLCEAAIEYSDNAATNVLLDAIGGPSRVTAYARSIGDRFTRLDRNEPSLNSAIPGDPRDTTTPLAMVANLQRILTQGVLTPRSRQALLAWMIACKTGISSIRAGVPANWRAGDKTGSGAHATVNDVAVLYPPGRAPIFVTAYYTGSSASVAERYGVLAEVGRILTASRW